MSKSNKINFGVIAFCILSFLGYFSYNQWYFHRTFYKKTFSNLIEDVRQDSQGSYEIKIDTTWVYVGSNVDCIDTIQKGDSIFKSYNTFVIILKRKSECYKSYKYECIK